MGERSVAASRRGSQSGSIVFPPTSKSLTGTKVKLFRSSAPMRGLGKAGQGSARCFLCKAQAAMADAVWEGAGLTGEREAAVPH